MDPEERRARIEQIMRTLRSSRPGFAPAAFAEYAHEAYENQWPDPELAERLLAPADEDREALEALASSQKDADAVPCEANFRTYNTARCKKYREDLEKNVNTNEYAARYAFRKYLDLENRPHWSSWWLSSGPRSPQEPKKKAEAKTSARAQDDAPGSRRNR